MPKQNPSRPDSNRRRSSSPDPRKRRSSGPDSKRRHKPDQRKPRPPKPDLRGLSLDDLKSLVKKLDEPAYRAGQIADWAFVRGVRSIDEMTNLSKTLRERLAKDTVLTTAEVVEKHESKRDGTKKLLLKFKDGARIEAVLLKDDDRLTGCVSSQVGCKYGCSFCATGSMGFDRDLTAGEIIEQVIALREAAAPARLSNLVFMGMGEPLDNYANVMAAIRIANAEWGLGIGARRITVSTAGHVAGIERLAKEGLQVQLAVSLNAPRQGLRSTIMPIADVYSLTQLTRAIERYSETTGRRATLEYVLLRDINDTPEMADEFAEIARSLLCKVNLICYNEATDSVYAPSTDQAVEQFFARVSKRCHTVVRRISRGGDIAAGCGQLCVPLDGKRRRDPDGGPARDGELLVVSAMNRLRPLIAAAVVAALVSTGAAATAPPAHEGSELELLVREISNVLPESWRIIESGTEQTPIGWTGPGTGLYVMVEDTSTRFFHPSGFHYYSFYRVWLMPAGWEGEMRHTPYIADSAPAFLLGLSDERVALYHTAGGNVWSEGPAELCSALGLNTVRYSDLNRRVVDLEIEGRLTDAVADDGKAASRDSETATFEMSPYRIVGLAGDGPGLYMEYVFGNEDDPDESQLDDLTEQLAGSVFEKFPEVESLYLRRCTRDTFTDTIVNRD